MSDVYRERPQLALAPSASESRTLALALGFWLLAVLSPLLASTLFAAWSTPLLLVHGLSLLASVALTARTLDSATAQSRLEYVWSGLYVLCSVVLASQVAPTPRSPAPDFGIFAGETIASEALASAAPWVASPLLACLTWTALALALHSVTVRCGAHVATKTRLARLTVVTAVAAQAFAVVLSVALAAFNAEAGRPLSSELVLPFLRSVLPWLLALWSAFAAVLYVSACLQLLVRERARWLGPVEAGAQTADLEVLWTGRIVVREPALPPASFADLVSALLYLRERGFRSEQEMALAALPHGAPLPKLANHVEAITRGGES